LTKCNFRFMFLSSGREKRVQLSSGIAFVP